ncbi:MAG: hypothetical protein RLZZ165_1914 [Bacteroidota bacterium]|jgi:hypothetical protein
MPARTAAHRIPIPGIPKVGFEDMAGEDQVRPMEVKGATVVGLEGGEFTNAANSYFPPL